MKKLIIFSLFVFVMLIASAKQAQAQQYDCGLYICRETDTLRYFMRRDTLSRELAKLRSQPIVLKGRTTLNKHKLAMRKYLTQIEQRRY